MRAASEPPTKRGEGRVRSTFGMVEGRMAGFVEYSLCLLRLRKTPEGSPLDKTGPIPAELLKDPFTVEPSLWDVQNEAFKHYPLRERFARTKQFLTGERVAWIIALSVSWVVTLVAVLRAL